MLRIRPEIEQIVPYRGGPGMEEIARRHGLPEVIKLASNESPYPPFPGVTEAVAQAITGINRYPDLGAEQLAARLSQHTQIPADSLWLGAGSSELLTACARALGGPGANFVYPWPSFTMYRVNTRLGAAQAIEVPLDSGQRNDLEALAAALGPDTTMVVVCNPNNPTGTYRSHGDLLAFLDLVPEHTLAIVDEAYAEFAVAPDFASVIPAALRRPNLVVARTFSKMYGLAGLRVGYMIGQPQTLAELRKAQIPFSVNRLAAVAAMTALDQSGEVEARRSLNRQGVEYLTAELHARGVETVPTQTNFLWVRLGPDTAQLLAGMEQQGVIVRALAEEWTRVSIGSERENHRFIAALDAIAT